jgi:hypothetical protein
VYGEDNTLHTKDAGLSIRIQIRRGVTRTVEAPQGVVAFVVALIYPFIAFIDICMGM